MKKVYFILLIFSLVTLKFELQAQVAPENFDIGLFPIGTFNHTNTPNQRFEVAIKTNAAFPAIPAAAELNIYLTIPTNLLNGSEVFQFVEDSLNGGNEIWQSLFPIGDDSYIGFVLTGTPVNLSLYPSNNNWVFIGTVTIANMTAQPWQFHIADQSSSLWTEFGQRTALSVLFYNEFMPLSSIPGINPLPVKLLSFAAEKSGEKNALLFWSTASESNTSYFSIERSKDQVNWTTVGQVQAAGNSQIVKNYQYLDNNVYNGVSSKLTVYYRLKMVDLDGSFEYSPIESVKFGNNNRDVVDNADDFFVYPNPASEGIHVEWDADQVKQPTSLEFYDLAGKLVYTEKVEDQTDQKYVDFTKTNIQSGLIMMRVLSGDETINYKQIVVGQNH